MWEENALPSGEHFYYDESFNMMVRWGWVQRSKEEWLKSGENMGCLKLSASEVLCDHKIPMKLKGRLYERAIRPTMIYNAIKPIDGLGMWNRAR